jgi:hypothetical protein
MSPGKHNTLEDIDYVIETFAKIAGKLRRMSPTWDEFEKGTVASAVRTLEQKP